MTRLVLIGVLVSIVVIVLVLWLIRARKLQERQALLWLVASLGVVVLGLSSGVLEAVARTFGIAYPPSALFLLVVGFLGLALLDAVITISKLSVRTRTLAQRLAIMDERLETMARQIQMGSEGRPDVRDRAV
jgi:hypothetical protein